MIEVALFVMILVVIVLGILIMGMIISYNAMVRMRNQVKNAWTQIDVQLKRRHDVIPNLVETVKGYASHEKETFEKVTRARNQAVSANTFEEKAAAESALNGVLKNLLVTVESYPELQANENFLSLQEELVSTENKIAFARQHYNDQVMEYNNRIQTFPASLMAGMFNFKAGTSFELADKSERAVPKVSF